MSRLPLPGIPVLDSLRGFAALSVCLFHFVYSTIDFVDNTVVRAFFAQGMFGVQTFFVISGFIIPYSMHRAGYRLKNFFEFMLKRLARLEPPYIFSVVATLLLLVLKNLLAGGSMGAGLDQKQLALHLGYLIPFFEGQVWLNEVYWTLAVEFQFYLLMALLFVPLLRASRWQRWLMYAGILAVSQLGNYEFLPRALPFFLLGIVLFFFRAELSRSRDCIAELLAIAVFIFFNYQLGALVFGLVAVGGIGLYAHRRVRPLHQLGRFSYSIYLLHPVVGSSLINILSHRASATFEKLLVLLIGLAVTVMVSWCMYYFIERPSQNLSKSISYGE